MSRSAYVNLSVRTYTNHRILVLFFKKAVARVQRIFTIHSLHVGFQFFLGFAGELLTRDQVNRDAPNGMINAGDHYKKVGTTNSSRHRITRGSLTKGGLFNTF